MKIAFIGLGNMGGGMAANLVKAGHQVRAFDLNEEALARARENGCDTAGSIADRVDQHRTSPGNRLAVRPSAANTKAALEDLGDVVPHDPHPVAGYSAAAFPTWRRPGRSLTTRTGPTAP